MKFGELFKLKDSAINDLKRIQELGIFNSAAIKNIHIMTNTGIVLICDGKSVKLSFDSPFEFFKPGDTYELLYLEKMLELLINDRCVVTYDSGHFLGLIKGE